MINKSSKKTALVEVCEFAGKILPHMAGET